MKLRRVAYHEAAHAIVAAHFGLLVDEVGVEVAARLEAGVVVAMRGRPLVRATVQTSGDVWRVISFSMMLDSGC
jgi:hypothetical protein